ncbi:hypothetical protein BV25DRAFT_1817945, partial [Artomyces pyxidatus]
MGWSKVAGRRDGMVAEDARTSERRTGTEAKYIRGRWRRVREPNHVNGVRSRDAASAPRSHGAPGNSRYAHMHPRQATDRKLNSPKSQIQIQITVHIPTRPRIPCDSRPPATPGPSITAGVNPFKVQHPLYANAMCMN